MVSDGQAESAADVLAGEAAAGQLDDEAQLPALREDLQLSLIHISEPTRPY